MTVCAFGESHNYSAWLTVGVQFLSMPYSCAFCSCTVFVYDRVLMSCIPPSQLVTCGAFYAWQEFSPKQEPCAVHEKCYEVSPALDQEPGELDSSCVTFFLQSSILPFVKWGKG